MQYKFAIRETSLGHICTKQAVPSFADLDEMVQQVELAGRQLGFKVKNKQAFTHAKANQSVQFQLLADNFWCSFFISMREGRFYMGSDKTRPMFVDFQKLPEAVVAAFFDLKKKHEQEEKEKLG